MVLGSVAGLCCRVQSWWLYSGGRGVQLLLLCCILQSLPHVMIGQCGDTKQHKQPFWVSADLKYAQLKQILQVIEYIFHSWNPILIALDKQQLASINK